MGLGDVVERLRALRSVRRSALAKTVVVIDDEPDQVKTTVLLLQSTGHTAVGSTDGSEGIRLVSETGADAVVLDFILSNMTGADVCRTLRANPQTGAVRILFLSGTEEAHIRASCKAYDGYLRKPAEPSLLFEALAKL